MIAGRTRGELAAAGVLTAAVLALAVVTFVAHGWWTGEGGSYAPIRTLVSTDVTPPRSLFGEVLTARARIVVDPRKIDPRRVELRTNFAPYRVRSASRELSDGLGRAAVVQFSYALQCTSRRCLPRGGGRLAAAEVVELRAATATFPQRDGSRVARRVAWPAVAVQSRLTADEIGLSTPRPARIAAPARVTWRLSPGTLGGLAFGAALLLALAATWLIASVLLRDLRLVRAPRIPSHLTPVDRALALAEHAAANGEVDESRKALERLSIELQRLRPVAHAEAAERLAWSKAGPSRATVSELAQAVRSNGAR